MKYRVEKTIEVAAAHALDHLDYDSPCKRLHGHNWMITVCCEAEALDRHGMVADFALLKRTVMELDHRHLEFPPWSTAEAIGAWVMTTINAQLELDFDTLDARDEPSKCVEVRVRESRDNLCVVTA